MTTDGMVASEVAFIIEFTVSCDEMKSPPLYAAINDKILPVVKSADGVKYQISCTEELSKVVKGTRDVKIYDEEQFVLLRKTQRNGFKTDYIASTFSIPLYYLGNQKPLVKSEFLALICSVVLWHVAFSMKSKLVN